MSRRRTIAAALAAGFVLLLAWVELIGPFPGDRALLEVEWHVWRRPLLREYTQIFELLGTPTVAAATIAAAAVVVGRRRGVDAAAFVILAGAVPLLTITLKALIGPTPPWQDLHDGMSANFPSGHVAYAVAMFGALAWLCEGRRNRDLRFMFILLAALMAPARILLHVHLLSDVLAGACVGGVWLIGAREVVEWRVGRRRS